VRGNAWVDAPASRNAGAFLYDLPRTAWEPGENHLPQQEKGGLNYCFPFISPHPTLSLWRGLKLADGHG